jgi:hypothetical protein
MPDDPARHYHALTGGSLKPHVDVGVGSYGARMEETMRAVHPEFPVCVQSQFVCRAVPRGGATLVVSPGPYYTAEEPTNPLHFDTSKQTDVCVCTPEGYAALHGTWRAVDDVPRGCLIVWISRLPHGNKLADPGVNPQRRVVYVAWQARALVPDADARAALKRKKMDALMSGGTTDHWATHVPKVHRGSHYSNGKGASAVLYTTASPPTYDAALLAAIDAAM